jgi:hypothetical protein
MTTELQCVAVNCLELVRNTLRSLAIIKQKFSHFLSRSASCAGAIFGPEWKTKKSLTKYCFRILYASGNPLFILTRYHFLVCYKMRTKAVLLAALTNYWLFCPTCGDHTDHVTKAVTFCKSKTAILVIYPLPFTPPAVLRFFSFLLRKVKEKSFSVRLTVRGAHNGQRGKWHGKGKV